MKSCIKPLVAITILGFIMGSCNNDRNYEEAPTTRKISIDSIKVVSDTMAVNSVQSIRTYSTFTSSCEGLYGYDYVRNDFTRTVTAYKYTLNGTCTQTTNVSYGQFNFQPVATGTYTFKFWNGTDSTGSSKWITKTIVVK